MLQADAKEKLELQESGNKELEALHRDKYIIMPDSVFRIRWDLALLILVLYYGVTIPITIAFANGCEEEHIFWTVVDSLSTLIFILGKQEFNSKPRV